MLHAIVHAADIQDRDGGAMLMATLFGLFPFLLKLYADGGYQGPEFRKAIGKIMAQVDVEIVKRSDKAKGFIVLPNVGSWKGRSHGSDAAAASRKIIFGGLTRFGRFASYFSAQKSISEPRSARRRSGRMVASGFPLKRVGILRRALRSDTRLISVSSMQIRS
jgi:hypothetical protein